MATPFRYAKIGYAALTVTNLERSIAFYAGLLGLDLVASDQGQAFLRCSRDHHNLVLVQGAEAGLRRIGFQLESNEQVAIAYRHFEALGFNPVEIETSERQQLHQADGFRVRESASGLMLEYYSEIVQLPRPFEGRLTKIARLGHVLITSRDYDTSLRNFTENFGFKVSDHTPGAAAFLRCFPNRYHHSFGISKGEENRLHHLNFMVSDIDDIGRAMNRLRKAGVDVVFGPGRHFSSGSIFLYFLDPDGLTAEYSFEMEEFPEVGARQPRMLDRSPETSDLWGGSPTRPLSPKGPIQ